MIRIPPSRNGWYHFKPRRADTPAPIRCCRARPRCRRYPAPKGPKPDSPGQAQRHPGKTSPPTPNKAQRDATPRHVVITLHDPGCIHPFQRFDRHGNWKNENLLTNSKPPPWTPKLENQETADQRSTNGEGPELEKPQPVDQLERAPLSCEKPKMGRIVNYGDSGKATAIPAMHRNQKSRHFIVCAGRNDMFSLSETCHSKPRTV